MEREFTSTSANGALAAAISNAIVALYASYMGRGPTRARAVIGVDLVTVVLEESLTKPERRLLENGEGGIVRSTRRTFQDVMRREMVGSIETLMGRTVVAFLSDHQVDPDYAVEVFVLEPIPNAAAEAAAEE